MISFILYNLRQLFKLSHLLTLLIYLSFAWLLCDPAYAPEIIYNSRKVLSNYELILYSIMLLNYVLFISVHFKNALKNNYKELLLLRFTNWEVVLGLTASYYLYFIIGFMLPAHIAALAEQFYFAPGNIRLSYYFIGLLSNTFNYIFFWITFVLALNVYLKSYIAILSMFTIAFGSSYILNLLKNIFFNNNLIGSIIYEDISAAEFLYGVLFLTLAGIAALAICKRVSASIGIRTIEEQSKKGIFEKLSEKMSAHISMHHYGMLGNSQQKLIAIFGIIGLALILILLNSRSGDFHLLANLFIGALMPIIFSFDQHRLIKIDRDAGMVHNNFLRSLPYWRIVLNRWLIMLIPQLLIALFMLVIIRIYIPQMQISFMIYVLLLNIMCSGLNLLLAVITKNGASANLILLLFIYLQLRDDTQIFIANNPLLSKINIYGGILQEGYKIETGLFIVLALSVALIVYLQYFLLKKTLYINLEKA